MLTQLAAQVGDLRFEHEDAADQQGSVLQYGQRRHLLHGGDVGAAVAALAAVRPRWSDDRFDVEPAEERRLTPIIPAT